MPQDKKSAPEPHPPQAPERSEKTACMGSASSSQPGELSPAEAKDPLLGTVVGSFQIVRKLGGGGMGTVYLGEHTVIGSKVAVKFLHEHFASNEALVQRFLAEARAVNLIGHENIINIFDMNVLPPRRHYMVMEYLEGQPLSAMTGSAQPPPVIVSILTQVCDALQAAHLHGVIHRDLKPENIFLVRHDRTPHFVKVLDFGIAKLFDGVQKGQTSVGTIIGTPEYMAPEQWSGHAVDGRTDLYALGIIGYELLTGQMPFAKGGLGSLLHAHLQETPPSPRQVNPQVPEAFSQAIMRALAKRPEERFRSASEMRAALEQALSAPSTPKEAAAEPRPSLTPPPPPAPATLLGVQPAAPAPPRPAPAQAQPLELMARVVLQPGAAPTRLPCTELARGGLFVCTDGALPPLRARVPLTLELRDRELTCSAEVVRHLPPAQASAWAMRAGFAVQFVDLTPEAREALARVAQGQNPPPAPKAAADDPQAESLLTMLNQRPHSDPYALLALPLDAPFDDVRQHARAALRALETIAARPLSARQAKLLAEVRARVEKAADTLSHPRQRIEHDAWRNNYTGVARCISCGLLPSELEALRTRFLAAHPGAEARERIHAATAAAWESQGSINLALEEYEKALTADPLNLTLQQRYWTLKQRGARLTPPPPEAKGSKGQDVPGLRRRPGRS